MKSTFQFIVIVAFIGAFILAVIVFSGVFSSNDQASTTEELSGTVVMWGVADNAGMQAYVNAFNSDSDTYTLTYEYHAPEDLYMDLITAIANGVQPDVVIVSSESFAKIEDKLYTIPYAAYSERAYRDTNVDGAQVFMAPTGIKAFPLLVDPLVVYYNKDLLAGRNFLVAPRTWDDLVRAVPLFVRRDAQNALTQIAIGMGTGENITHARDILSALFLQTGDSIVSRDARTGLRQATLGSAAQAGLTSPSAEALTFYTSFADPLSGTYTWNRSLASDLDQFLASKSGFYIGRASELFTIQEQNPNLNFDVMPFFQPVGATRDVTYGSFLGAAVLSNALNFAGGYDAIARLASPLGIDALSKNLSIPPVRRDLLLVTQENPYVQVFFQSAASAFSWADPDPSTTEGIFRAMITEVSSGAESANGAIYNAARSLQSSLR